MKKCRRRGYKPKARRNREKTETGPGGALQRILNPAPESRGQNPGPGKIEFFSTGRKSELHELPALALAISLAHLQETLSLTGVLTGAAMVFSAACALALAGIDAMALTLGGPASPAASAARASGRENHTAQRGS